MTPQKDRECDAVSASEMIIPTRIHQDDTTARYQFWLTMNSNITHCQYEIHSSILRIMIDGIHNADIEAPLPSNTQMVAIFMSKRKICSRGTFRLFSSF